MMECSEKWTGASTLEILKKVQYVVTDPKELETVCIDVGEEFAVVHECRDRVRARGIRVNVHRIVIITILALFRTLPWRPLAGIAVEIAFLACSAVITGEKAGGILIKGSFFVSFGSFVEAPQGATRQINVFGDVIKEVVTRVVDRLKLLRVFSVRDEWVSFSKSYFTVVLVKNLLATFPRPELQRAQSVFAQPLECCCATYSKVVDILDEDAVGCCRISSDPGVSFRGDLETEGVIDETSDLI
jgi:hypothetical protein